jgi:hypothetical protein
MSNNQAKGGKKTNKSASKDAAGISTFNHEGRTKLTPKMAFNEWVDNSKIQLGKVHQHAEYIMRRMKNPVAIVPEQKICANLHQAAMDRETLRQIDDGVDPADVVFNFPATDFDEAILAYREEDEDLNKIVAGLPAAHKVRLNAIFKTAYDEEIKLYYKELVDIKKSKPVIFNSIMDLVGTQSRDKLKTHQNTNWDELEASQDPAELMRMLRLSHTLEVNGSRAVNQLDARKKYEDVRQRDNESTESLRIRYVNIMNIMKELGLNPIDQEIQAQDFLSKLGPQYSGLLSEIERNDANGIKQYPVSLAEAYYAALSYHPPQRPQKMSGTVFTATGGSGNARRR